jgi:hypothetical protein
MATDIFTMRQGRSRKSREDWRGRRKNIGGGKSERGRPRRSEKHGGSGRNETNGPVSHGRIRILTHVPLYKRLREISRHIVCTLGDSKVSGSGPVALTAEVASCEPRGDRLIAER